MAKRIQLSCYGGPEQLQWIDFDPSEPTEDEVQVENKAIGINYIDIYIRNGLYPVPSLPSGIGTEAAGVVTKVGRNVTTIKPGERVVYAQALGAYSEIHNVHQNKLIILPDAVSFEQAAALFLKGLTVYFLMKQTYKVHPEEIFLFHAAAGGVGLIACQWAKALGAYLIGTVSSAQKAQLAKDHGAWATIYSRKEDIAKRVNELTHTQKVRVVYDSVGKATWEASLNCLQRRGLMVSFGNASGPVTDVNLMILSQKGSLYLTRPSLYDYIATRDELHRASNELFSMIIRGIIRVEIPEKQHFPLRDAKQAHIMLENRLTYGSSLLIP